MISTLPPLPPLPPPLFANKVKPLRWLSSLPRKTLGCGWFSSLTNAACWSLLGTYWGSASCGSEHLTYPFLYYPGCANLFAANKAHPTGAQVD